MIPGPVDTVPETEVVMPTAGEVVNHLEDLMKDKWVEIVLQAPKEMMNFEVIASETYDSGRISSITLGSHPTEYNGQTYYFYRVKYDFEDKPFYDVNDTPDITADDIGRIIAAGGDCSSHHSVIQVSVQQYWQGTDVLKKETELHPSSGHTYEYIHYLSGRVQTWTTFPNAPVEPAIRNYTDEAVYNIGTLRERGEEISITAVTSALDGTEESKTFEETVKEAVLARINDEEKVSIVEIIILGIQTSDAIAERTPDKFRKETDAYLKRNEGIFSDVPGDTPVLIRVPIEVLADATGDDGKLVDGSPLKEWLEELAACPRIYIELYTMQDPEGMIDKAVYERYGLSGEAFPDDLRGKTNCISLFGTNNYNDEQKLAQDIRKSDDLKRSIIVPLGLKGDHRGVERATVFGLRLVHIARNPDDEEFKQETVKEYNALMKSYKQSGAGLTVADISALLSGNVKATAKALLKIIELLPMERISVEAIKEINNRTIKIRHSA